jgi:MFS family permease
VLPKSTTVERLVEAVMMFVVASLSFLLLLYVGFGDGRRNYEAIEIEKLTADALSLQNSIEKFLRNGLPLKEYAGFSALATPIVEGADVDAATVYDQAGKQLFIVADKGKPVLPPPPSSIKTPGDTVKVQDGDTHYQIVVPLRTRFETAGTVVLDSPRTLVTDKMRRAFLPLVLVAETLAVLFAVLAVLAKPYFARSEKPWLPITYSVTFLIMAIVVIGTLVSLYVGAIEGKAKASASTLAQRLSDIVEFKLDVKDFDGLDRPFAEYKRLNAEVSDATLLVGNVSEISTDPRERGKPWTPDDGKFEYRIDLTSASVPQHASVVVTVLKSVVFARVARSVKNFAALFIASAFLSGLFLQIAASVQRRQAQSRPEGGKADMSDAALQVIKPIYFLAVFLDSLTYSFLPKFMQETATGSGVSVGFASLPFTAYYLCFALSLIPAGSFAERYGPKPVLLAGLALASASVLCLALPFGIFEMTALRALAGIGQGVLMIGVQSYILAFVSPEKKTQGTAIIVFGFQGGLLSGMALGSLLFSSLHASGVFAISGSVGLVAVIYTFAFLARSEAKQTQSGIKAAVKKLASELKQVMTNLEFLKTLLCIGAPAKAILTGVISFALPLILGQLGYRPEDIGQVIMLYGLGVLASSGYISRYVDRTKNSELVLFLGAVMSGLGLMAIGLMNSSVLGNGTLCTITAIVAVSVVGIAHGFINAPVVSHVGHSDLAKRIGANPVMTAYRFVERGGHVSGPLLVSQLFLIWGQGPAVIGGIGLATALLGVAFLNPRSIVRQIRPHVVPAE